MQQKQSPEYMIFYSAKSRCCNPNNRYYKNYGGRGIKFLFNSVDEVLSDIGPRPDKHRHFDRIDNNGHYEKGNVRWATYSESHLNKRKMKCLDNYSDEEILAEVRKRSLTI